LKSLSKNALSSLNSSFTSLGKVLLIRDKEIPQLLLIQAELGRNNLNKFLKEQEETREEKDNRVKLHIKLSHPQKFLKSNLRDRSTKIKQEANKILKVETLIIIQARCLINQVKNLKKSLLMSTIEHQFFS
jgi:hypothetical protein